MAEIPDWAMDTAPAVPDWAVDTAKPVDYGNILAAGAENAYDPLSPGIKGFVANIGKASGDFISDLLNPTGAPSNMSADAYRQYMEHRPPQGFLAQLGEDTSLFSGAATAPIVPFLSIGSAIGQEIAKESYEPEEIADMLPDERQKLGNLGGAAGQAVVGLLASGSPLLESRVHDNIFPPENPPVEPPVSPEGPILEGEYASSERGILPRQEVEAPNIPEEPIEPQNAEQPPDWAQEPEEPVASSELPKLSIRPSDAKDAFNVLDENGDHVQGGFDSRTAAEDYIDQANEPTLGNEPEEWGNEVVPYEPPIAPEEPVILPVQAVASAAPKQNFNTEQTPEGQQDIIPGAERITDKELAERTMEQPLQTLVQQKPMDEGLFDVAGRGQQDLLDLAGQGKKDDVSTNDAPIAPREREIRGIPEGSSGNQAKNQTGNAGNQIRSSSFGAIGLPERQVKLGIISPSSVGKPTSLYTFLKNNNAKISENNQLVHMKDEAGKINKFDLGHDRATELTHQAGYFSDRPSVPDLQNALLDSNGGRNHYRNQDIDRVLKSQENAQQKQQDDPTYIEHYADRLGLDTGKKSNETPKQFINRLKKAIQQFHKDEEGAFPSSRYKRAGLPNGESTAWALKKPIETIEKVTGKLTGNAFEKMGDAYTKIMAPELVSGKALRADAYLAKHKAEIAEARNALYKQSAAAERAWDRASNAEREAFLEAQDTGNYINNDPNNPAHARYKALTDATHRAESKALGRDPTKGYRDNYFPRIWEKPDEVRAYLHSPAMIKKYGPGWFNKARQFDLYREAKQAGFKLITNNPETLLQNRLMAGQDMIARMNLLRDLERDGLATPARAFSVDKRIADTEAALTEARKKYKVASNKINDPKQDRWSFADPAVSKYMKNLKVRGDKLNTKLEEYKQEKGQYKLSPETLNGLKGNGFKIIGPDEKVWHLDNDMIPLWKNVMDSRGLWENKGLTGSAYRGWQALRNTWVPIKLGLSLFHPLHVASIHVANGLAEAARNLTQGGKLSNSAKDVTDALKMGFGVKGINPLRKGSKASPAIEAWNKPASQRTAVEQQIVDTMKEGGFVPAMSERDIIHFRRGFENALHGNILQKTVVMPVKGAQGILRAVSSPIFEHWIPALKTEAYLMRARNAIARDPSLATDAGKRGEVLRQIAKDTDRTYGEMNYDTLFWNKAVRDAFNASFLSGGWKLAQLYYARGLATPFKMAYKFAKTGEFNPKDISHNMAFSYVYGAMGLLLGAAFTKMMGGQVNSLADMVFPQTGEKDKDGKPIRVSLPFFNKEFYSLGKDISTKGLIGGSGAFALDQTLFKNVGDTLNNEDYMGRKLISDPSDFNQWAHQAWDTVKPITLGSYQQAETRGSKVGKPLSLIGIGLAPAYANQTPFEQKVLYEYDKANPPKGDAYTASLKSDYRAAFAKGDEQKMDTLKKEMMKEGMTGSHIAALNRNYTQPFVKHAWQQLPAIDQRRIINSASDEEKSGYRLKPLREAQ